MATAEAIKSRPRILSAKVNMNHISSKGEGAQRADTTAPSYPRQSKAFAAMSKVEVEPSEILFLWDLPPGSLPGRWVFFDSDGAGVVGTRRPPAGAAA
jgi:hypothetical protein